MSKADAKLTVLIIAVIFIVVITGCSKPYIITNKLTEPLVYENAFMIGAITDELPSDFEGTRPPRELLDNFKSILYDELVDLDLFSYRSPRYEVTGIILDYKKNNEFLYFLFGGGVGAGKVVVALRMTDTETGVVVFGGNFTGMVRDWAEDGQMMFKRIANDFAEQLEKAVQKAELESLQTG